MPPSRRSSSSHSRSRSSSRSSRSSSRSRSRSRSRSSHSSGYSRSSYSSKPSFERTGWYSYGSNGYSIDKNSFAFKNRRPVRTSSSAPKPFEYRGGRQFFHCYKHDYYHYDTDFTDQNGVFYNKGYYDEEGTYYPQMTIQEKPEAYTYECHYCGNDMIIRLDSMSPHETIETMQCSSCGAGIETKDFIPLNVDYTVLTEDAGTDVNGNTSSGAYGNTTRSSKMLKILLICVFFMMGGQFFGPLLIVIASFFLSFAGIGEDTEEPLYISNSYEATETNPELFGDKVFVPEIGRTCVWSDEYECYYDNATECYFWYNNETSTPQMQYWYEDFSSDYGDYGWLEYDVPEDAWYVEYREGEWSVVENPPDYFWHTSYDSLLE